MGESSVLSIREEEVIPLSETLSKIPPLPQHTRSSTLFFFFFFFFYSSLFPDHLRTGLTSRRPRFRRIVGDEVLLGLMSGRTADMNKENDIGVRRVADNVRITRSRAKAVGTSTGILPSSRPSFKQDHKRVLRASAKRAASNENKPANEGDAAATWNKKRAVLKDVTNVLCKRSFLSCVNAAKHQTGKNGMKDGAVPEHEDTIHEVAKVELATELSKIRVADTLDGVIPPKCSNVGTLTGPASDHVRQDTDEKGESPSLRKSNRKRLRNENGDDMESAQLLSTRPSVIEIDSRVHDPQACTSYAHEIYSNIRTNELERRPSFDYMERLQCDISPGMRSILIDWLVEVSEEYKLVPDTLYLTVNLIDRFLSQNYIKKQSLQLLGITCMLIASKYEEICAPRVDEFCFITDNTYTREEVLKQESQVLNHFHFQLSFPSTKSFLRRFIQAAQASSEFPSLEMEFLANYLAELTLIEYSFLKFLPSVIAASAVLLARWTLNQSDNPWNPTLEHYTSYKVEELKTVVLAIEGLQLNTSGCSLNAVRQKYKQQKFRAVSTLTSSEPVQTLFQSYNNC
ncbi:hypothetical protein MLD38_013949 [Melastoma candidum]|uniref:Uncharacterized protein n=1 Tax=Melastoma candidum TaxID=119954 RepID=A0ACB9REW5_9MYRT|nr:hypothetical protein MLD38_013949 [Melastoma candidum]